MAIAAGITWLVLRGRAHGSAIEGLQDYDDLLKIQDTDAIMALLKRVQEPQNGDALYITFPKEISLFALAKYKRDPVAARKGLLEEYDQIRTEMSTSTPQARLDSWTRDPKKETCSQITSLQTSLKDQLVTLKASIRDISGTQYTMMSMRDENMAFQKRYTRDCDVNLTEDCKRLASQEEALFPLLPQYDSVNETMFEKEVEITETIDILSDVAKLLGCSIPETSLDIENDIGVLDTDALKEKLEQLSPYYLSPGTLQYVSRYLTSGAAAQSTLNTTTETLGNMTAVVGNIQSLTAGFIPRV
jgi:hypothetical protein